MNLVITYKGTMIWFRYQKARGMLRCAQHDKGGSCHAERSEASLAPYG